MDPLPTIKTEDIAPGTSQGASTSNHFIQVISPEQLERLRQMHTSGKLADVNILLSDGIILTAHKQILAMASQYAYDSLMNEPNADMLDLTFIQNAEVGKLIVDHFYGGASVPPELVPLFDEALEMVGCSKAAPVKPDKPANGKKRSVSGGTPAKDKPQAKKLEQFQESDRKNPEIMKAGEKFACRYCFQPFASQPSANRHIRLHFAASMETFNCMRCDFKNNRIDHLKSHCIKIHNMDKDFATAVLKEMYPGGKPKKNRSAIKKEEEPDENTTEANGIPPSTSGTSQNGNGTPPKRAKRSKKGIKKEPADDHFASELQTEIKVEPTR